MRHPILLVVLALAAFFTPTANLLAQPVNLSQDFDQGATLIADLQAAGWFTQNNSQPLGTIGYFNGNTAVFPPHMGAGYLGVNFNSGSGLATISNWMLTPVLTIANGTVFNFATRTTNGSFPDRLQIRLSTSGASTNVGTTATDVGDFTRLLLDINPTYTSTGYPLTYEPTQNIVVSGVTGTVTGRFAFRYFAENAGPSGANSDYIGIDTLRITGVVPEPTSLALLGIPALGGMIWRRRRAKVSA